MIGKRWKGIWVGPLVASLTLNAQAFTLKPTPNTVAVGDPVTFELRGAYSDLIGYLLDFTFPNDQLRLTKIDTVFSNALFTQDPVDLGEVNTAGGAALTLSVPLSVTDPSGDGLMLGLDFETL